MASSVSSSPSAPPVHVFKFGGTSVATAERIRHVVKLVLAEPADVRRVVVVSALGGVTDRLLQAIDEAVQRTERHRIVLEELRKRHAAAVQALVGPEEQEALLVQLAARWRELGELLDGVYLLRECTLRTRDALSAWASASRRPSWRRRFGRPVPMPWRSRRRT